jgi:CRISPR/Cas system CSM-associated protein Csm2 small subunit
MKNQISTIQIRNNVKDDLDRLREKSNDSYENIIARLIDIAEQQKRKNEELLIEGCKEMAEDMIKINRGWESADNALDWEW